MTRKKNLLRDFHELARLEVDAHSVDRALNRVQSALNNFVVSRPFFLGTKIMSVRNFAAVAAIAVVIFFLAQLIPSRSNGNFAFAQVQTEVEKAKSVQYMLTEKVTTKENKAAPQQVKHVMVLGTDRRREEVTVKPGDDLGLGRSWALEQDPYVSIYDGAKHRGITIYPEKNAFILIRDNLSETEVGQVKNEQLKPQSQLDFYTLIRHVPSGKAKQLPERTIDGKRAVGFLIEETTEQKQGTDTWRRTYWVDPSTRLPIRIDVSFRSTVPSTANMDAAITEITFGAVLDPELFSTDPPAGYTDLNLADPIAASRNSSAVKDREQRLANGLTIGSRDLEERNKTVQYTETIKHSLQIGEERSEGEVVRKGSISGKNLKRIETKFQPSYHLDLEKGIVGPLEFTKYVDIFDGKSGTELILFPEKQGYQLRQDAKSPALEKSPVHLFGMWAIEKNGHPIMTSLMQDVAAGSFAGPIGNAMRSEKPGDVGYYDLFRYVPSEQDVHVPRGQMAKLPQTTIDGKAAIGFRIHGVMSGIGSVPERKESWEKIYWVDPTTNLPIRIESAIHYVDPSQSRDAITHILISDIVYDAPLEPKLFSTDPPEGWTNMCAQKSEKPAKPKSE